MISKNRKILYFYFILHRILQKTILLYIMILNLFSTINDLIYIYIFFFYLQTIPVRQGSRGRWRAGFRRESSR